MLAKRSIRTGQAVPGQEGFYDDAQRHTQESRTWILGLHAVVGDVFAIEYRCSAGEIITMRIMWLRTAGYERRGTYVPITPRSSTRIAWRTPGF